MLLFNTVLADISVTFPQSLSQQFIDRYPSGIIPSSMGNFGNPPYGTSLTGHLIVLDSEYSNACSELPPLKTEEIYYKPIVLVQRGECAYVVKVRNAQTIGAHAVIIINENDDDPNSTIMTDNGQGGNLEIPAFLIRKSDGNLLINYKATHDEEIAMHLSFDIIALGDTVNFTIWTQSSSASGMTLLSDLSKKIRKMEGLLFTPHFFVWNCGFCEENNYVNVQTECISGGRYCSYDPDGVGKIEGRDVVMEDLRQLCVFQVYKGSFKIWMKYIESFFETCFNVFTKECSEKAMKRFGISTSKVQECIDKSIMGKDILIDDNAVMYNEKIAWEGERIPFNPAIVINSQLYRGDLEADSVINAICMSYQHRYRPSSCSEGEGEKIEEKSGVFVIFIIIGLIFLVIGGFIVYRKCLNRELKHDMKLQVNEAVAHYFQLAEVDKR